MNLKSFKMGLSQQKNKHIGIMDIGSNSIRLVIYRCKGNYTFPIFNERVTCKLGEGIDKSSRLKVRRINLALNVITRFSDIMNNMNLDKKIIFATAAVRRAKNGSIFKDSAEKILKTSILVLSADEEAELVTLGITENMNKINGLIADLGGGSLEIILLKESEVKESISLNIGHLSEKTDSEIKECLKKIDWLKKGKNKTLYGVGGSFRALGTAYIKQTNYPLFVIHGLLINKNNCLKITKDISKKNSNQTGIPLGRRATMPMAAIIIKNIINISKVSQLMVSGTSVRDGWIAKLNEKTITKNENNLLSICKEISNQTERFRGLNNSLIKLLQPVNEFFYKNDTKSLFKAACLLSDISWNEHPDLRGTLAVDRILALSIFSISHIERAWLAKAIYHRYIGVKENKPKLPRIGKLISRKEQKIALAIGLGLRFGHVFCAGITSFLSEIKLKIEDDRLICILNSKSLGLMDEHSKKRFKLFARNCELVPEIYYEKKVLP